MLYFTVFWFKITNRIFKESIYSVETPLRSSFYCFSRMAIYIVIMLIEKERRNCYFCKPAAGYLPSWVLSFSSICHNKLPARNISRSHVFCHLLDVPTFLLPKPWSRFLFNTAYWFQHPLCSTIILRRVHRVCCFASVHEKHTRYGSFPEYFSIWVRTVSEISTRPSMIDN